MSLSPSASEASKLLEAALEQMDGIIQGAKFDHQNHQVVHAQQPSQAASSPAPARSYSKSNPISEALRQLHSCLLQEDSTYGQLANFDAQSVEFVFNWLRNNLLFDPGQTKEDYEAERENFQFQLSMLNEQIERQSTRISELEQLLSAKNELLRKTEAALDRERGAKDEHPNNNAVLKLQSDLAKLKTTCGSLEKENVELRRLVGGDRTPKYLPISPQTHSPSPSSSTPDTEHQPSPIYYHTPAAPEAEPTKTPKQSFRKIFGKIKRSNSGGQLQENLNEKPAPNSTKISMVDDQPGQNFRRGGLRATAGGRLGWSSASPAQVLSKKQFSDWSSDVLCVWMDSLGLGMYTIELKKYVNYGDQLSKMTMTDLENKLGMKSPMHRKKLVLAMKARQDTNMESAQGGLDHHWVTRWLDDVGLPQYKDTFFEARVDGRVLNVLTIEDLLCHLKITNLLHHLSLRRGIQVRKFLIRSFPL